MSYGVLECDIVTLQNCRIDFLIKDFGIKKGRYLCQTRCVCVCTYIIKSGCYGLHICVPPTTSKFTCCNPDISEMAFGGGTWVMRVEPSRTGWLPFWKRPPWSSPAPSGVWGHNERSAALTQTLAWPCWRPVPGLTVSRTVKNEFLLFISYPIWDILL